MTKQKLYTVSRIAEMLDVTYNQAYYATARKIKIKSVKTLQVGEAYRPSNLFNIAAVNKVRRHFLRVEKKEIRREKERTQKREKVKHRAPPPYHPEKGNAISDAAAGMHDAECTELLRAVDRYKRENRLRYGMKVSDWLKVFKSMPKPWIENLLREKANS